MDIGRYIVTICKDLDQNVSRCEIVTDVVEGVLVATERAVAIALIVNELITNAAKYAYKDETGGKIDIKVQQVEPGTLSISVGDEGTGLPQSFDPRGAKGLGMRLIAVFIGQLNAKMAVRQRNPGTEFVISIPLDASTS